MNIYFGRWWVRLLVLYFVLLALYFGAAGLFKPLIVALHGVPPALVGISFALLSGAIGIFVYRGLVRRMEARNADELSQRGLASGLAIGTVIGFVMFAAVIAILAAMGDAAVATLPILIFPAYGFALAVVSAVFEELIMRGAMFRIIEDRFGSWPALIVSAAIFGLLHGFNHGATIVSTLCIAFEAGLLLAAAYMATRSLWLPIGLHFGWNFTEGGIFGTAVSGGKSIGVLKTTITGPVLISGGEFGPEASVIALAVCSVVTAVLFAIAIRRGHWRRGGVPA
jgi:uncharacterized protein